MNSRRVRCAPLLFAPHFSQSVLVVSFIAMALVLPSMLCAQAYFGTVSGELTDATGAVVQGATVVLTDQQKGFSFTTTSDSSGRYLFRSIYFARSRQEPTPFPRT